MAETITLEGEAAAGLQQAAERAGFADAGQFVRTLFPTTRPDVADSSLDAASDEDLDLTVAAPPGSELRKRQVAEFFRRLRESGRNYDMTTDEVMEMTRGKDWKSAVPFDDDEDEPEQRASA